MGLRIYGDTSGYVDINAPSVAGSASVTLPGSGTLALTSALKVLQVVSATAATAATTTSTSFADTGLSASITPSAASSKILALVFMPFRVFNGPTAPGTGDLQVNLVRATTEVFSTASQYVAGFPSGSPEHVGNCMYSYMDSPSSTSSLTYKAQYKVASTGSATVMIGNKTATLTLLEIGA